MKRKILESVSSDKVKYCLSPDETFAVLTYLMMERRISWMWAMWLMWWALEKLKGLNLEKSLGVKNFGEGPRGWKVGRGAVAFGETWEKAADDGSLDTVEASPKMKVFREGFVVRLLSISTFPPSHLSPAFQRVRYHSLTFIFRFDQKVKEITYLHTLSTVLKTLIMLQGTDIFQSVVQYRTYKYLHAQKQPRATADYGRVYP